MGLRNTSTRYGVVSKVLHWLVFVLVATQVWIGYFTDGFSEEVHTNFIVLHKSIGLTLLALIVFFIVWIPFNVHPSWPNTMPTWERWAAKISHHLLLLCVLLMTLSGWGMATASGRAPSWFGFFSLSMPGIPINKALAGQFFQVHSVIAWVLVGLVSIHISAAFKHQFWDKDGILHRMMPM